MKRDITIGDEFIMQSKTGIINEKIKEVNRAQSNTDKVVICLSGNAYSEVELQDAVFMF